MGGVVPLTFSLLLAGACFLATAMAVAIVVRIVLKGPEPVLAAKPIGSLVLKSDWDILFQKPPAVWIFPSPAPDTKEHQTMAGEKDHDVTAAAESDARIQMVRLEERLAGMGRDVQGLERLFKDGMSQIAQAIDKQATAFNTSFESAKLQFVAKGELEAMRQLWGQKHEEQNKEIAFLRKVVLGFCAFILIGFMGAVASQVFVK